MKIKFLVVLLATFFLFDPVEPSLLGAADKYRIGAICGDGTESQATGSGACSHHGGVACWKYSDGTCSK